MSIIGSEQLAYSVREYHDLENVQVSVRVKPDLSDTGSVDYYYW